MEDWNEKHIINQKKQRKSDLEFSEKYYYNNQDSSNDPLHWLKIKTKYENLK